VKGEGSVRFQIATKNFVRRLVMLGGLALSGFVGGIFVVGIAAFVLLTIYEISGHAIVAMRHPYIIYMSSLGRKFVCKDNVVPTTGATHAATPMVT
jgi:hypothetical protein